MKKIILCLFFTLIFYNPACAIEYRGVPMYCRVQIEYRDKADVMRRITEDMEEEGYILKERNHISLLFEAPLRKANRFNYSTDFGLSWFPRNRYGWRRPEFSVPLYHLNVQVLKKTVSSVEVTITPTIIYNLDNPHQEVIYEYYFKTEKALDEYLNSLKEDFNNN